MGEVALELTGRVAGCAVGYAANLQEGDAGELRRPRAAGSLPRHSERAGSVLKLARSVLVGDSFIAAGYGAEVDTERTAGKGRAGTEVGYRLIRTWKAGHGLVFHSPPEVVFYGLGSYHNIAYGKRGSQATGGTSADQQVAVAKTFQGVLRLYAELRFAESTASDYQRAFQKADSHHGADDLLIGGDSKTFKGASHGVELVFDGRQREKARGSGKAHVYMTF